jgi:carbonic anhydrase/acetyltransferase-like protein (isoleucine patch superfamily)
MSQPRTAVVFATSPNREDGAFQDRLPAAMLQLADRPFLQHVVEVLIDQGIRSIHFVLGNHPEVVERHFREGGRWGSEFHYHLAENPEDDWNVLNRLPLWDSPSIVIADGEMLPRLNLAEAASILPVIVLDGTGWSGWAVVSGQHYQKAASMSSRREAVEWLYGTVRREGKFAEADCVLSVRTGDHLLRAQELLMGDAFPEIQLSGRQFHEGIRLGRQARVHPDAELVPPVFIGADSIVGARTRLGPNVVVGHDCIIEPETSVRNSLVCDGSFVGEHLILDGVLVDQSRLRHVRLGTEFTVPDDLVLDSVHSSWLRKTLRGLVSRLLALVLFIVLVPVALAVWIAAACKGVYPIITRHAAVKLPVSDRSVFRDTVQLITLTREPPEQLNFVDHFLFVFLPGLPQVILGKLHLAGVPPRDSRQIATLPQAWRNAYLHSNAGLVTEAMVCFTHPADPAEQEASEIYFANWGGIKEDMRLLGRYLLSVVREWIGLGPKRVHR